MADTTRRRTVAAVTARHDLAAALTDTGQALTALRAALPVTDAGRAHITPIAVAHTRVTAALGWLDRHPAAPERSHDPDLVAAVHVIADDVRRIVTRIERDRHVAAPLAAHTAALADAGRTLTDAT